MLASGIAELDHFAARFDDLVGRFDDALARERRLTAQASHELRTPLTLARAEIDGLANTIDPGLARERALAALDRLSELVEICCGSPAWRALGGVTQVEKSPWWRCSRAMARRS